MDPIVRALCRNREDRITPSEGTPFKLIYSFLAFRSYIHDSNCSRNASNNVDCILLAHSVVHGAMAGYTSYISCLIKWKTNIHSLKRKLLTHIKWVFRFQSRKKPSCDYGCFNGIIWFDITELWSWNRPDLFFVVVVAEYNIETEQYGGYG